jgi:hypothetical protein
VIVIAFDPGVTTGWCAFETNPEREAKPLAYGQVKFLELISYLETHEQLPAPDVVIIESFQLLSHKAQKLIGSKFETIQAIGICKSYAQRHGARIVEQPPTIKNIAQKWTGVKPPSNHAESHWIDAFNHGKYYMIKNEMDKSQLQLQGGKP